VAAIVAATVGAADVGVVVVVVVVVTGGVELVVVGLPPDEHELDPLPVAVKLTDLPDVASAMV
jgi:hypothetical protein